MLTVSRILLGLVFGAALALQRSHAGSELLSLPGAFAGDAAGARARALIVIGLAALIAPRLLNARKRGERAVLLVASAVGFSGAAFALGSPRFAPPELLLTAVVLVLALLLGRRVPEQPGAGTERSHPLALLATAVGAAGVALCLEGLARPLAERGGGLPQDAAVFATVLLAVATIGGFVLSGIARGERPRPDGGDVAALCALAGAAAFGGALSMYQLASDGGFLASLARVGLDLTAAGTLTGDAWIGATVLAPAAIFAGAALFGARRAADFAALAFGAAAGVWLAPTLLAVEPGAVDLEAAPGSFSLLRLGALVAAAGAIASALVARGGLGAFPRVVGIPAAIACALLAWRSGAGSFEVQRIVSGLPVRPLLVCELPEGQLVVDPPRGDGQLVSLAGRAIAPDADHARVDALAIVQAFDLLPDATRVSGPRVLFAGQMTRARRDLLNDLGAVQVDRGAAWWRAMAGIEALTDGSIVNGAILAPGEARARIADGVYDLVLVPPCGGSAPVIPDVEAPAGTLVVAWIDGAADDLAARAIGRPLLLLADGIEQLCVGIVWGRDDEVGRAPAATPFFASGEPTGGSLLARLEPATWLRPDRNRLELGRRLENANVGGPHASFTAGLRRHLAVQSASSPYETREQRIELDEEALDLFYLAGLEAEPDRFLREWWVGLSRVLRGKRDIVNIYELLEPLEETWGPWKELVLALAEADLEELDPDGALARLETVIATSATDPELFAIRGRAHEEKGDYATAAEAWRRARELRPGEASIERSLGIALFKANDPEGKTILEGILKRMPEDVTVAELLGVEIGHDH
ncbi:MAG: hypothetical protein GY711_30935 [bacterium]|nr:hypothetical protein [bacterium]